MKKLSLIMVALLVSLALILVGFGCAKPAPAPAPPPAPAPAPAPPPAPKPAVPPKVYNLVYSGGTAGSATFVIGTVMGEIMNKYLPEVKLTITDTVGPVDNVKRVKAGDLDLGAITAFPTIFEAYHGLYEWEGKAVPSARVFIGQYSAPFYPIMRKDSGVATWSQLEGKKFWIGQTGSSARPAYLRWFKAVGLNVNTPDISTPEALSRIKTGQIDGIVRVASYHQLDANSLEIKAVTPITVATMTKAQADIALPLTPGFFLWVTPAGVIKDLPELGELLNPGYAVGIVTSDRLPQEIGYRMVKTLVEHWSEVTAAAAVTKPFDPVKDTIKAASAVPKLTAPLHAGTVQYFKEAGVDVPAYLIPPEYKK